MAATDVACLNKSTTSCDNSKIKTFFFAFITLLLQVQDIQKQSMRAKPSPIILPLLTQNYITGLAGQNPGTLQLYYVAVWFQTEQHIPP
jgi:hypothetical protein